MRVRKRLLGSCLYNADPHYKSKLCLHWGRWTNQRRATKVKKVIYNMTKLGSRPLKHGGMKKYSRNKLKIVRAVIEMPADHVLGHGNFWFFFPVPFLMKSWPFKKGQKLLVTVTEYKGYPKHWR
jgi:hypothetical protein